MTDTAPGLTRTVQPGGFDYWPASASRIGGLGGQVVDPDPTYAFHTKYVELGSGVVRCTLRFVNLQATMGLLTLRINGLPPGPGARAETVRTWTASLPEMAEGEGVVEISFQASAGSRYAVLGQIYDETDARARSLDVTLVTTLEVAGDQRASTRKSIFGRRVFRRANRMFQNSPATLSDPVSQACTAAQFDEPAYARWIAELQMPDHRHRKHWEPVYILQVLSRYGMLRPGARGLGFGTGNERLPAVMASHGCTVVATDLARADPASSTWDNTQERARSIESLRFPQICADEVFDRQVTFRTADMNKIPGDLAGFDFTWSSCALEHLGSIENGLAFIRNSVNCLTFGGVAVYTTEFNISSNEDTVDNQETVLFRKRDLERLAVDLVSRGHYAAQFNYDLGTTALDKAVDVQPYSSNSHLKLMIEGYVTTSFGIIVRRGDR
jgi:hypothetical protein